MKNRRNLGVAIIIIGTLSIQSMMNGAFGVTIKQTIEYDNLKTPISLLSASSSIGFTSSDSMSLPTITITFPQTHSQLTSGLVNITGLSASTGGARIDRVEFHEIGSKYKLANPVAPGNWSKWSVLYNVASGNHTLQARVTDADGKQNWNSITVSKQMFPVDAARTRIAIVNPTFTWGAYSYGGFYNFYNKHLKSIGNGANVTDDLNMLTHKVQHGPFRYFDRNLTQPLVTPEGKFIPTIEEHVKDIAPSSQIAHLEDVDIHDGKIFKADGSNAYDTLILFHAEYMTQQGYNNLRNFTANGGTILFAVSNSLTTEVKYDQTKDTVTLVKGHGVTFDRKAASKGPEELWRNENIEWRGGNFLDAPTFYNITLAKLPFTYDNTNKTHIEEQVASNHNDKILANYGIVYPKDGGWTDPVASYEHQYGLGRVIEISIWSHRLQNDQEFWSFIDHIILPRTIAPSYIVTSSVGVRQQPHQHEIFALLQTGEKVGNIQSIKGSNLGKLTINLEEPISVNANNSLMITVPKEILGNNMKNMTTINEQDDNNVKVLVDGKVKTFTGFSDDIEIGIIISLSAGDKEIQIVQQGMQ